MAFSGNKHMPNTSPQQLAMSGSLTHSWSLAGAWAMGIEMTSGGWLHATQICMVLWDSTAWGRHKGIKQWQTAYVLMDLRLHHGLEEQHGPQTSTWPPVAPWTMVILPGGPIQKVNFSSSWASKHFQDKPGGKLLWSSRFVDWVCICLPSRLLFTIPPALQENDIMATRAYSLFCHSHHIWSPTFSIVHA